MRSFPGNKFDAVAFDLDGTLYPNYRLNLRLIPFAWREFPLLLALGKTRALLHGKAGRPAPLSAAGEDFYGLQARLMGGFLHADPALTRKKIESLVYRGWEPFFKNISLFPRVKETLISIRSAGCRLALLSDFPPEKKLEYLGISGIWDAVICSERVGSLKPAPAPFAALIRALGFPPERVLYVGNSRSYDVLGAKQAGMKTALISWPFKRACRAADLVFRDYRQLGRFVLG
jgi:putative hydrolase of the HAD superfamily